MIIEFLGDSITQGAGASKEENTYVYRVGAMLNVTAINHGLGGTRIAKQQTNFPDEVFNQDFLKRKNDLDKNADFVFVFGGTNDFGHGNASFGDINSTSDYTFYGAMKNLLSYLVEVFGKDKICVILPMRRHDDECEFGERNNQPTKRPLLCEYSRAEQEVAKMYGVDTLNFNDFFPKPKGNCADELTVDGLHPNDYGHSLIANRICEYLKNKKLV